MGWRMEHADLEALARLEALATPAPWHVRFAEDNRAMGAIGISTQRDTDREIDMDDVGTEMIAATLIQAPPYVLPRDGRWVENAQLIVAMRNALPELLRVAGLRTTPDPEA